jgi:hypothetical protein
MGGEKMTAKPVSILSLHQRPKHQQAQTRPCTLTIIGLEQKLLHFLLAVGSLLNGLWSHLPRMNAGFHDQLAGAMAICLKGHSVSTVIQPRSVKAKKKKRKKERR